SPTATLTRYARITWIPKFGLWPAPGGAGRNRSSNARVPALPSPCENLFLCYAEACGGLARGFFGRRSEDARLKTKSAAASRQRSSGSLRGAQGGEHFFGSKRAQGPAQIVAQGTQCELGPHHFQAAAKEVVMLPHPQGAE